MRIDAVFQTARVARPRTRNESACEQAVATFAALHQVADADVLAQPRCARRDAAHTVFNMKEFIYIP